MNSKYKLFFSFVIMVLAWPSSVEAQSIYSQKRGGTVQVREHLVTTYYYSCALREFDLDDRNTTGYIQVQCGEFKQAYRHPDFPSAPPPWVTDQYATAIQVMLSVGYDVWILCNVVEFKAQPYVEVVMDCLPDQRSQFAMSKGVPDMYTSEHAELLSQDAGKKWQPSNGYELDLFMRDHCSQCSNFCDQESNYCCIHAQMMHSDVDDADYPQELVISAEGQPVCTSFDAIGSKGKG